jgi:serine/threonine protein kinase
VYTEAEARDLFVTLVSTIAFLHDNGVVHRDLKVRSTATSTSKSLCNLRHAALCEHRTEGH